jgi:cell division protease FtsH
MLTQNHVATIGVVTQRLLEFESIDNEDLRELLDAHSSGPWLVPGTRTEKPRAKIRAPQNPGVDIAPTADNQI